MKCCLSSSLSHFPLVMSVMSITAAAEAAAWGGCHRCRQPPLPAPGPPMPNPPGTSTRVCPTLQPPLGLCPQHGPRVPWPVSRGPCATETPLPPHARWHRAAQGSRWGETPRPHGSAADGRAAHAGWGLASRHSSPVGPPLGGPQQHRHPPPERGRVPCWGTAPGPPAPRAPPASPCASPAAPGQSWLLGAHTTRPPQLQGSREWLAELVATNWMATTGDLRALGQVLAKTSHIQNLSVARRQGGWYGEDRTIRPAPPRGHTQLGGQLATRVSTVPSTSPVAELPARAGSPRRVTDSLASPSDGDRDPGQGRGSRRSGDLPIPLGTGATEGSGLLPGAPLAAPGWGSPAPRSQGGQLGTPSPPALPGRVHCIPTRPAAPAGQGQPLGDAARVAGEAFGPSRGGSREPRFSRRPERPCQIPPHGGPVPPWRAVGQAGEGATGQGARGDGASGAVQRQARVGVPAGGWGLPGRGQEQRWGSMGSEPPGARWPRGGCWGCWCRQSRGVSSRHPRQSLPSPEMPKGRRRPVLSLRL